MAAHIHAATANARNRTRNHPYLGTRAPLLRHIDYGLCVRAGLLALAATGHEKPGGRTIISDGIRECRSRWFLRHHG